MTRSVDDPSDEDRVRSYPIEYHPTVYHDRAHSWADVGARSPLSRKLRKRTTSFIDPLRDPIGSGWPIVGYVAPNLMEVVQRLSTVTNFQPLLSRLAPSTSFLLECFDIQGSGITACDPLIPGLSQPRKFLVICLFVAFLLLILLKRKESMLDHLFDRAVFTGLHFSLDETCEVLPELHVHTHR